MPNNGSNGEEIIGILTGSERRRHARTIFTERIKVSVQPMDWEAFTGIIHDVSHRGIGFFSERWLVPGETFFTSIALRSKTLKMQCVTARCIRDGKTRRYLVGAKILIIDTEPVEFVDNMHVEGVQKRLEEILGENSA